MPVEYDDSMWPVVTLRMIDRLTESEEDEFIEFAMVPPRRHEPYVGLIDLVRAQTPSARFVRKQASAMARYEEAIATYCRGTAFVANSPMIRGAIRAVLHLQRLPCPRFVTATNDAAWAWARGQLPSE